MRIQTQEGLKKFEETLSRCRKTVWIMSPDGTCYNMDSPSEYLGGISCLLSKNPDEEAEVFASCPADEALLFEYLQGNRLAA